MGLRETNRIVAEGAFRFAHPLVWGGVPVSASPIAKLVGCFPDSLQGVLTATVSDLKMQLDSRGKLEANMGGKQ